MNIVKKTKTYFWTYISKKSVKSFGSMKVNGKSRFTKKTVIGNNCHFNGIEILGDGNVYIGDNFHSGEESVIFTSYHNYDGGTSIPYDNTWITKDVYIDENVWIGTNVTIMAGVHIGEGAVIQTGSVVVSDVPACAVVGGHPGKVFKYRDKEHYYKLKSENSFF